MDNTLTYVTIEETEEELDARIEEAHKRRARKLEEAQNEKVKTPAWAVTLIIAVVIVIAALVGLLVFKAVNPSLFEKQAEKIGLEIKTVEMSADGNLTSQKEAVTNPLDGRQVYYAGLEDCVVNSDSVVYLENLKENDDIFMAYEISTNGEKIYETGLIPSGNYSKWTPSEVLTPGTYELSIKNIPYYDLGDGNYEQLAYQPVNVINMTVVE